MSFKGLVLIPLVIVMASLPAWGQTLKIATISPEGSMWMEKMREGAKAVADKTQNRVKFKFYPGGVMGNDKAVLRKIRIGQLHGGAVVAGSLSGFFPGNQIYSQPMKFRSQAEVDFVREKMDDYIVKGLDDAGFVTFGISGGGFAYIMSKEPVESVADLKARKVWVPDNDQLNRDAAGTFDITPIPLPLADVRTSLASGLIDTVGTSPVAAIVLQWHTEIKYVTNIPLIYLSAVLAIDKKQFNRISPEDQAVVREIMGRKFHEIDLQNREDNTKAIAALKQQGITFITPKGKDLEEWLERAKKASEMMVSSGDIPAEPMKQVDALLKAFRQNAAAQ